MRVSDKMRIDQINRNVSKNRNEMSSLQNQAATLKRVTKPSDDAVAAARVLAARVEDKGYGQFQKNILNAKSSLEFTDQTLSELSDVLNRAKELAIAQASDAGSNEGSRRAVASEVHQLFEESLGVANRRLGDRYIFSGYKTNQQPFDKEGNYRGDGGEMKVQTHKDSYVTLNIPGNKIFLGEGVGKDGMIRSDSEVPKNVVELKAHQERDLEAKEAEQEFENSSVHTRGPASVAQVHTTADVDPVSGSTGINVFQALRGLEISLRTNDKDGIQTTLENLDQAINQVVLARSEIGSRVNSINNIFANIQQSTVDNKALISQLEDADMYQVASEINKTEQTLKATMETSGKLISPSLLDFIK